MGARKDNGGSEEWTMVGARNEMTVNEIKRFGMVDIDNVHLTRKMNRTTAQVDGDNAEGGRQAKEAGVSRNLEAASHRAGNGICVRNTKYEQ